MRFDRSVALTSCALLCLAAVSVWSYGFASGRRAAARAAAADAVSCRQLAAVIDEHRQGRAVTAAASPRGEQWAARAERAAEEAGLDPASIIRVRPASPALAASARQRREESVHLALERVTLREVTMFLHTLVGDDRDRYVKAVKLVAPRQDDGDADDDAQSWAVEATVARVDRASAAPSGGGGRPPPSR